MAFEIEQNAVGKALIHYTRWEYIAFFFWKKVYNINIIFEISLIFSIYTWVCVCVQLYEYIFFIGLVYYK